MLVTEHALRLPFPFTAFAFARLSTSAGERIAPTCSLKRTTPSANSKIVLLLTFEWAIGAFVAARTIALVALRAASRTAGVRDAEAQEPPLIGGNEESPEATCTLCTGIPIRPFEDSGSTVASPVAESATTWVEN